LSIIATPPPNRLAVQTFVTQWDNAQLREAFQRELSRGGQLYFLHNDVESMGRMQRELSELVPEARIGMAHGQMPERELEQVMLDFQKQRFNVLLASTIIESGIDIPNANTIIIHRADRFGLAQLHQLRGRVGRGSAASHCVLLYHAPLSQLGRERLSIMRETCDGFVIAEKDLELRGPGEMLGTRQTGLLQFKVADLMRDADLLPAVREAAQELLARWPQHVSPLLERWLRHGQQYGQV
jgi:ATP-dependent DNA helicase RecG